MPRKYTVVLNTRDMNLLSRIECRDDESPVATAIALWNRAVTPNRQVEMDDGYPTGAYTALVLDGWAGLNEDLGYEVLACYDLPEEE